MRPVTRDRPIEGVAGMSGKWLVSADDPTITSRAFTERLRCTENPRHRQLLETVIAHDQAEAARDLEATMVTLTAEPQYGRYWGTQDVAPKGNAAVRAFYEELFSSGGIGNLKSDVKRVVVDDHTVIAEFTVTALWPWRVARSLGCSVEEESGHFAIHRPLVTVIPFGDDLKMCGECSYGGGFWWERVPDDALSPGYRAWAERFHPAS
jgi:hypothetical protein